MKPGIKISALGCPNTSCDLGADGFLVSICFKWKVQSFLYPMEGASRNYLMQLAFVFCVVLFFIGLIPSM